jgi:hypothetical protein
MKILFVGGMYHAEISLGVELDSNPNLRGICCGDGTGVEGWQHYIPFYRNVSSFEGIRALKNELQPDLTLFRSWVSTTNFMEPHDILYSYEVLVKDEKGNYFGDMTYMKTRPFTAYQSIARAREQNEFWLPYCVSKYYEKQREKEIPILLATNIPSASDGGDYKIKACDILVKPVVKKYPKLFYCYSGHGMERIPYLKDVTKGALDCKQLIEYTARAKILISPDCVWYNDGTMSHKTIQGMGCGTIVITNNHLGLENIIGKDGEHVLYSDSPEETLDKVKFYLSHDTEREKISQRAYDFVHGEYNWEKHLNRLLIEYKERTK